MAGNYIVEIEGTNEVHGPFGLKRAKDFARIGASHGKNDRSVINVRDEALVRVYEAGSGARLFPRSKAEAKKCLTPYEIPREFKSKKNPSELRSMVKAAKVRAAALDKKKKAATTYGIFVWETAGMYRPESAVKVYKSRAVAEKYVDKMYDLGETEYVVRTIVDMEYMRNPSQPLMRLGYSPHGKPLIGEIDEQDVRYVHVFSGPRYIGQAFDSGAVWAAFLPDGQMTDAFTTVKEAAEWLSRR